MANEINHGAGAPSDLSPSHRIRLSETDIEPDGPAFQYESGRIYAEDEDGNLLAEVTFPETVFGVANIDHTFVAPALRGKGVADRLVREAIRQIAKEGKQAIATCPYAEHWFEKHPDELEKLFDR